MNIIKKIYSWREPTNLIENHFYSKLLIPGNFEHIKELENLVSTNLAVGVLGVDDGEQLAEEIQGFCFGQPLVGVSVQLKWNINED